MKHSGWVVRSLFSAGLCLSSLNGLAQAKVTTVPDAQVESNVLKALAGNAKLADQTISSSTVYGTVTLSGSVRDEESRKLAETVASRAPGVQKVIDELTLSADTASTAQPNSSQRNSNDGGSNPLLQSDGTMAPSPSQAGSEVNEQANAAPPPQAGTQPPSNSQVNPSRQQPYPQANQPQQGTPYDPYAPPYRRPYGHPPYPPPTADYRQPSAGTTPYGAQQGGQPVTVPSGSMLRVRINLGLDSRHAQPGTVFDAVVLNDVVADGFVAIPRGATVQGTVVDSQKAGALRSRGELALRLTQVTLAGRLYPIASDVWSNSGGDKTVQTVNSALGLGAVGAIIGGVTGGGAGAAIGAGIGGAAGVGASAASDGGQAFVPSEAILTFHLTQEAALATVSQAEMDRLGYGTPVGAQMRRRYARPVPYGYPAYYPRYLYPYAYRYPYPY